MAQPQGATLEALRARRTELRDKYLESGAHRPTTPVQGVHHLALICRDVEETIRFYQGLLGFPLVELLENRDYAGSSHFFFDIGNRNLLGFFDFPGHEHPPFNESVGGIQHLAISATPERFEEIKAKLESAGIDYLGPDRGVHDSLYFKDPSGVPLEIYSSAPGIFAGKQIIG